MQRKNQQQEESGEQLRHRLGAKVTFLAGWLETLLSLVVLVALVVSCLPMLRELLQLFRGGSTVLFHEFLASVLNLVIGLEFIEMLTKHNPGSALEVLLFAIVRHMLIGEGEAIDNLLSVLAIAVIFLIRKFAFSDSFGEEIPEKTYTEKEEEPVVLQHTE